LIRYQDLLGARFLALDEPEPTDTTMPPDGTFYPPHTAPALSLTALFDGFKPLFDALTPVQANRLAADVVATFQGTGGSITALFDNVAELTGNLSKRDALIAQVIDNLDVVLRNVADHDGDLASLIDRLAALTHGLSSDRHRIAGALDGVDSIAASLSDLIGKGEPVLHHDIADLFLVAGTLVRNVGKLAAAVAALPGGAAAFTRSLGYGTWLNGYVCADAVASGKLIVPVVINGKTWHSAVCRGGR
jgi:phospholipid/cholesterol/gamma-HCH transport system substrate-binding protein